MGLPHTTWELKLANLVHQGRRNGALIYMPNMVELCLKVDCRFFKLILKFKSKFEVEKFSKSDDYKFKFRLQPEINPKEGGIKAPPVQAHIRFQFVWHSRSKLASLSLSSSYLWLSLKSDILEPFPVLLPWMSRFRVEDNSVGRVSQGGTLSLSAISFSG